MSPRLLWSLFAALLAIAFFRALTVTGPVIPPAISPEQAQQAFEALAAKEPEFREKASENFPADAWSQDDDFFAAERGFADSWARDHGLRRQDVFSAIDQGIREQRPLPAGVPRPISVVAPCKPRALE